MDNSNNNDETDIYCPICHSYFDLSLHLPRMLPECGHTLCNQCIILSLEKSDAISCPEDHIISHGKEAKSFPKNFSLLHIIERKQKMNLSKIPTNPSSQSSSIHSHTLKRSICSLKQSLETVGSCEIRNQGSQEFQETENESRYYCILHKKERDIVCFQCKEQICSNCALFGSHKKHDIRNLDEAKEVILKQANLIFSVVEQVQQKISFLKSEEISKMLETALRDNHCQEIENVSSTFKEIVDAINEKQKQIKEELTNTLDNSLKQLKEIVQQPLSSIVSSQNWLESTSQDLNCLGEMSKKHELFTRLLIEGTPEILQSGHKELNQLEQIKNSLIENTVAVSTKAASVNQNLKLKEFAASIIQGKIKEIQITKVISKDKLLLQFDTESAKIIQSQQNVAESLSQIKRDVEEFYTKHQNSQLQVFSARSSVSSQEWKSQNYGKIEVKLQKPTQIEKDIKNNLQQQQIIPFNSASTQQEPQLSSIQSQQPDDEAEQFSSNNVTIKKNEMKTNSQKIEQEESNKNIQIHSELTKDVSNDQTSQTETSLETRPTLSSNLNKSNEKDQSQSKQQEIPKSVNINSNALDELSNGISQQNDIKKQENPQTLEKEQQQNSTPQTSKSKDGPIDFSNLPDFTKESLLLNQSLAVNSILCDGLSFFSQKEEHDLSGKKPIHKLNADTKLVYSEEEDNEKEIEEDDDENLVSQITNKDALLSQLFSNTKISVDDRNLLEESFNLHSPVHKQPVQYRKEQQNSINTNTEHPSQFFAVISGILNNSLDSADFSHMDIMDKGLEAVAFAMSENSSLHQLNLDRNKITDVGCIKLFETLESSQLNLESLNLNNNLITDKCLTALLTFKPKKEKKTLKIFLANNLINVTKQATAIKQIQEQCGIIIHT